MKLSPCCNLNPELRMVTKSEWEIRCPNCWLVLDSGFGEPLLGDWDIISKNPHMATALHDDSTKPPMAMLPNGPLRAVAQVMAMGAKKYGDHNWRKGSQWTRYASSALRHIFAWLAGEDNDPESGLSHLAHAVCNLLFILEWQQVGVGVDDRYREPK